MDHGPQALQYLLSGITKGSIYAVVAIGFNLIYSATGIINFAQGEFVMLGGMVAVTLAHYVPLPVAVVGAVAIVALVGCYRGFQVTGTLNRKDFGMVFNKVLDTGNTLLGDEVKFQVSIEAVKKAS
jgi:branched-subunit amino acid ABC-type transport system permease component